MKAQMQSRNKPDIQWSEAHRCQLLGKSQKRPVKDWHGATPSAKVEPSTGGWGDRKNTTF